MVEGESGNLYWRWKSQTFGSPWHIWHDGFSATPVLSLSAGPRAHAVHMLTEGVTLHLDGDAARALCDLRETAALPVLRMALPQTTERSRVQFALAIRSLSGEIEDDASMAREIIAVLEQPDLHWGVKLDAAMALKDFEGQESEEALLRAIEQVDYLVRYHASQSLLARWEVIPKGIAFHGVIFRFICDAKEGDATQDPAERKVEAVHLLKALKKLR